MLDVGHGNCTLLFAKQAGARKVTVIDVPPGDTLLTFLNRRNIRRIDEILISHFDRDHYGGLPTLLHQPNLHFGNLWYNPDSTKHNRAHFASFQKVLEAAEAEGRISAKGVLTRGYPSNLPFDDCEIEVLGPSAGSAVSGPGGRDARGKKLTSNTMSAVLRIVSAGQGELLLPGDLDQTGLENLLNRQPSLTAKALVFPHHGGRPADADPAIFARTLGTAVKPEVVIFSVRRGDLPRPEIVASLIETQPGVHIACTQLSKHCSDTTPDSHSHLHETVASGRGKGHCCAGTITYSISNGRQTWTPKLTEHSDFVRHNFSKALCQIGRRHSIG